MSRFYGDFDPASTATTLLGDVTVDTSSVVLYLPFDVDIQDDSTVGTSMTAVGNAFVQSSLTQFGAKALYLDGSGDYLQSVQNSSANSVFTLSSASLTIDGWLYPQTFNEVISNFNPSSPYPGFTVSLDFSPTHTAGKMAFYTGDGSSNDTSMASSTAFALNQWSHFAIVRGAISANSLEFFINGVKHGSHTVSYNPGTPNSPLRIGASNNSQPNRQFKGAMDDLRIIKGVALYSTYFSVPTEAVGNSIISGDFTRNTRTHSHVWNYTDVYDARFANTWPTIDTGPTTFSHIVRFDASMPGAVDTAAGSWTSVSGTNHPTTLVNGTTATLLASDQNGLNVVRTNSGFAVASADQVSTVTSSYAFVCIYSRNVATSASSLYPIKCGPGNNSNTIGIEIRASALAGGNDFDIFGGNARDREVTVAGADFQAADYTRYLIMASGNSSDGIHNVKVVVRGGTSSAVTLGTNDNNRDTAPIFLDNQARFPHANYDENIDYCEIIFYDVELSSADMITEADRLATKWGL